MSFTGDAYRALARALPAKMKRGWSITYVPGTDEYAVKILTEPNFVPGKPWREDRIPQIKAVLHDKFSEFPSKTLITQMILVMG